MEFSLPLIYPYSFQQTTKRLRFDKSSYRYQNGCFMRTIRGKHGPLLISVSCDKDVSLHVKITGRVDDGEKDLLRQKIARMFSTEVDLRPFYKQMEQDPVLAPVILSRKGMHIVLDPDLYECLIKTIVGQQLNVSFATVLIRRLIERAGDEVEFEGERWLVFPTPEQIARLRYEDLKALQFSHRKAEYIIDLARMIACGKLDLDALDKCSDEEVFARLLPIRGIGHWTVECVLLFGLGRSDLVPARDIGLKKAVQKVYSMPERPDEATLRKLGESWSPYASYVTFYLWDTLDNFAGKNKKS